MQNDSRQQLGELIEQQGLVATLDAIATILSQAELSEPVKNQATSYVSLASSLVAEEQKENAK